MTTSTMRAGERMRATYDFQPVDHLYRGEFYLWDEALERWKTEGLPNDWREQNLFNYDPQGMWGTGSESGLVRAAVSPLFRR